MENDKYIGRLLDGRYEILEPIGFGGMAVVYKARCHRLNRLVAVKILKDELGKDEEFRNRFHAESQAVAMLSHPNIMSVYDVSTHEDADYIVMELIDGITLKQYMEKKGTLNWKETLHFAMQIAKALEHAHGRGIVHRDIKPHNVMVLKNGSVKVTDFGIARLMSQSNTLTKEALGSVHYISPEQAKGGRVDNRSDLYSLGVVMYEMMTGRAPYDGDSPVAVAIQHINGGAVLPSVLNPNIPGGLEQIIVKCMATDPAQRYSSATALLYDLEELRKNPEILFPFGNANAVDEVLKVYPGKQNRNNAGRPAGTPASRGGAAPVRTGTQAQTVQQGRRTQTQITERRQNPQTDDRAERRSRAVTTTVVICSAVAVIAIIIFLVTLFNGGMLGNNDTLVPVPKLVGQVYDQLDASQYPTLEIVLADYDYSADVPVGVIMRQSPEHGEQAELNSKVKVWVSMGPEQEELNPQLDRLAGRPKDDAERYISAFNLLPLIQEEHSETVAAGLVIRVEPAEPDKPLEEGDTILVYVSLGREVKTARVPDGLVGEKYTDVVTILHNNGFEKVTPREEASLEEKETVTRISVTPGSEIDVTTEIIVYYSSGEIIERMPNVIGLDKEAAKETLDNKGFKNVTFQEEYDEKVAAGKVIRSNIVDGDKVDVTTRIILTLSLGPKPTEPPVSTAPIQPPEPPVAAEVTKFITIALPADMTAEYNLSIEFEGEFVVNVDLSPDTVTYEFELTGRGSREYAIYIDGELLRTEKVNFDA